MKLAWVCQIDAFARDDGAATTIRVASHDDERLCHLNGVVWWPAIVRLPTFAYDFFDGAFGGEIVTPSGRTELATLAVPGFAALMLHGARIRWWSGEIGAAWGDFVLRFDGLIENQPAVSFCVASLDFRVDDRWLDDPILATYAGTTGAEGEAAQKGQVKPLMIGAPRMVEGVLIDTIDTINQLSDGPIEGVEISFEDAARIGAPVANYASFAALDAATIAPGFVATALAAGLARHGAPGDGVLTYDIKGSNSGSDGGGWVRRTGAIVKRLAARQGKLAKVDTAALTALDAARPWNISIALTSQTTMRELVQSLAQSINAVALVTWTGLLTILPVDVPEGATPVGTLASDGSALPPVGKVDQLGIAAPWWRVAIEAEVTHRVHAADEIRFTANLVEVGIYDAGTPYREGNIASIADGSRWLYVGTTPTAGNTPGDGSAFWSRLSEPATGPAGPPGVDGAPGAPGADGVTYYTWYAYADAPNGSFNFTTGSPGDRVYQGIATGKTTATESTNPADYAWSPYVGPPNFGLVALNANSVLAGNKLIKVAGGAVWNASVHSSESFKGGASVSYVVDSIGDIAFGLNTDPTTDPAWESMDFAILLSAAGGVYVGQSGVLSAPLATYAVGDVCTITYNGRSVVYSVNGTVIATEPSPGAGLVLFLDSSLYTPDKQFGRILSFNAAGAAGADGLPGTAGAPGAPGANGTTYYTWYAYADSPNGTFNFTTGIPGGRQFQGVAYNKTTATESTDPADYTWSDYIGPPGFGLASFNANTVVAGNKLIKVAGGSAWNASIHSSESYKGGASVSYVVESIGDIFFGLTTDPTTDASWESIDFAILLSAGGSAYVAQSGVLSGALASYAIGAVCTITYNGRSVVYSVNGTVIATEPSPGAGLVLFFDSSLYTSNKQFGRVLSFIAAGTAGSDGSPGAPGSPGVSPVNAVAVPANKQFMAESDGTIKDAGSVLPFNVAIDGTKAGATISGTVTILAVSGCTATAISGGFTINTVVADAGFVSWRFTASDGQIVENKMSFSRQRDPASGGQVSVNFSSTSWWGSGSYGASGPGTVLPASSTGKLGIAGYASFYCSGNGQAYLTAKLQYRAVGSGTWIDSGFTSGPSVAIKTADAPGEPGENSPGEVSPGGTLTGLTANGSYEVQMVGLRNASFNAIASASGFITLRQVL